MSDAFLELEAMKKVAEAIGSLQPEAQSRVLNWAADHYSIGGISIPTSQQAVSETAQQEAAPIQDGYEAIGELFAHAQPRSDAEKALVAGYWLQVEQGKSDFATQDVNSELKDLGYGIGNITRAFESLKKTRPQQVIQLRKAGTSKQARKTFKVTDAGRKVVESMIRNRCIE
jgi:hypothetical protein